MAGGKVRNHIELFSSFFFHYLNFPSHSGVRCTLRFGLVLCRLLFVPALRVVLRGCPLYFAFKELCSRSYLQRMFGAHVTALTALQFSSSSRLGRNFENPLRCRCLLGRKCPCLVLQVECKASSKWTSNCCYTFQPLHSANGFAQPLLSWQC